MAGPKFMALYVADYFEDANHLTTLEHGAYMLLLMRMWSAGGKLPIDDARLAKLTKTTPEEWASIRETILDFFTVKRGALTHKRVTAELAKAAAISEAKRAGSAAREAKKVAGNDSENKAVSKTGGVQPSSESLFDTDQAKDPRNVNKNSDRNSRSGEVRGQNREPKNTLQATPSEIAFENNAPASSNDDLRARVQQPQPQLQREDNPPVSPPPAEEPPTPSPAEAKSRRKPERPIPPDFPDAAALEAARRSAQDAGADLDVEYQAQRFRAHAEQVDRRARDWPAAFRNWMLKAVADAPKTFRPAARPPPPSADKVADEWRRRLRGYVRDQTWNLVDWGPWPRRADTEVPPAILAEFPEITTPPDLFGDKPPP